MRFLIMPDSFKESLTAKQAAEIIKNGIKQIFPDAEFDLVPVGDGGEGTLDALSQTITMETRQHQVTGWDGQPFEMRYTVFQDAAFLEMADIVGLQMIPLENRAPLEITTKGIGELLIFLSAEGIKKVYIGVGGSATVDGGIGFAAGLGYRFYDDQQQLLAPIGQNLGKVTSYDSSLVADLNLEVFAVTDVRNPLCGISGASYVFGPQKGLSEDQLEITDRAMHDFYALINPDVYRLDGAGAGGGFGAAIATFTQGKLVHGIDFVLDALHFEARAVKADYIIVGEGRMDEQSIEGKAPMGIAQRAPKNTPVIAICGSIGENNIAFRKQGITAVFPIIGQPEMLEEALKKAESNLYRTAVNVASLLRTTVSK